MPLTSLVNELIVPFMSALVGILFVVCVTRKVFCLGHFDVVCVGVKVFGVICVKGLLSEIVLCIVAIV